MMIGWTGRAFNLSPDTANEIQITGSSGSRPDQEVN